MPLSENPQDQPAEYRKVDIAGEKARTTEERRKFLEDLKRGLAEAPKAPKDEDFGLSPLVDEEGGDISDVPDDVTYPKPKPKKKPGPSGPGGGVEVEEPDDVPFNPLEKQKDLQELRKIFKREYVQGRGAREKKEALFHGMIEQHVEYFYYEALLHNWGKTATKEALREQARRFRDEMRDESIGTETLHLLKDMWHWKGAEGMPTTLEQNPHFPENFDFKFFAEARERKDDVEQVLVNTVARTWFIPRFLDQTVTKTWYTGNFGDQKIVARDSDEFRGNDEGYFNIPYDFECSAVPFGCRITKEVKIPLPWGDKTPRKFMEDEIIPFSAKFLAARTAAAEIEALKKAPAGQSFDRTAFRRNQNQKIAREFLEILIRNFKQTLNPEHQAPFETWVRNEENVVDDEDCEPYCNWNSKIQKIVTELPK